MRPIDAEALICSMNITDYASEIEAYRAIANAPTVDAVPRWIPCEERLPENESEVLVTDNNGHIRHAFYDAQCDWFGTYEGSMTIIAIAWMPLPEPYGGEREDDESVGS